jgi:threonyl-tRNA synthetase
VPEVMALARSVADRLRAGGLRAEVSDRPGERMSKRVRAAEVRRVPYVVVIGKEDVAAGGEVVKLRDTRLPQGEAISEMSVGDVVAKLSAEAALRGPEAAPPRRG